MAVTKTHPIKSTLKATFYGELLDWCGMMSVLVAQLKADLLDTKMTIKMKYVGIYRQFRSIHDRYKASRDKEKFLRGHESEIILFETIARECKRLIVAVSYVTSTV